MTYEQSVTVVMLSLLATLEATDSKSETIKGRSHCYATENVDGVQGNEEGTRYKGQLTIQPDGSIVQTKTDREAEPLLIPYTPHTEDSSKETIE